MRYDVVIIGGGLGGLQCGYALARRGFGVCVLEKEANLGGAIQTFTRGGVEFDTGFHYVGGLDPGQPLHALTGYFGLLDLPWHRMDVDGFDEVITGGKSYMFACGDMFVEKLAEHFPKERENLAGFVKLLWKTNNELFDNTILNTEGDMLEYFYSSLFSVSAYDYIHERFADPVLRELIMGASMKLEAHPQKLPMYVLAQTSGPYTQSAWRLRGGGMQVAERLRAGIEAAGGEVHTKTEVEALEGEWEITAARLRDGRRIEGRMFISNLHPSTTFAMAGEGKLLRPLFRRRMDTLENTLGTFTANIKLKEGALPYLNRNQHIHSGRDPWSYHDHTPDTADNYVMASYPVPAEGTAAHSIDLMTPMHWAEVEQWADTTVGRRGEEYKEFKRLRAERCIDIADRYIPGLAAAIDKVYTSTPLTWRDYTGTPNGSAFGVRKDFSELAYTILPPRTPIPNLWLTGQNLSVHGIMGVSMTSLMTLSAILGQNEVADEFRKFID